MKYYALKTNLGNVVFLTLLEGTDINSEVSKWEETSDGVVVESILKLEGLPDIREDREILREELKGENVES